LAADMLIDRIGPNYDMHGIRGRANG